MHETLWICLGLIITVSFLVLAARKLSIAYPIFLTMAGLVLSIIPGIPAIKIDPDLIFLVVLPPILFDATQSTSVKALWKWRRMISVLALGFVLLTSCTVAVISVWLIPGFSYAQGFLLGAIISPPDAAAATSVLRYVPLPRGMINMLEGESLLNDASSLTIFRFALVAVITNNFVWYDALGGFFMLTGLGIVVGLGFGLIFYCIYRWLPTTTDLDVALSLVFPYLIYLTAESFNASGVLAVVSGGLFISYQNRFLFSHQSRQKSSAVWKALIFILNAVIFLLIGLQMPGIISGVKSLPLMTSIGIGVLIAVLVIFIRLIAAQIASIFTSYISKYISVAWAEPGWKNPFIMSWSGMRGVVSLASAFSIPVLMDGGKQFPHRDLILFITFIVTIITLVGQGLALPWVVKKIGTDPIPGEKDEREQILAMQEVLFEAGSKMLSSRFEKEMEVNDLLKNRLEFIKIHSEVNKACSTGKDVKKEISAAIDQFRKIMLKVAEHERKQLNAFCKDPGFNDEVVRKLQKRLDIEEEWLDNLEK